MGQLFSKSTEWQKKKPLPTQIEQNATEMATPDPNLSTPEPKKFVDPRSPTICRTPIGDLASPPTPGIGATKRLNLTTDDHNLSSTPPSRLVGTQKNFLQEKLLKNLGYQSFDPRSPTQFINRTPIRWEENDPNSDDCSLVVNDSAQAVEMSQTELLPEEEEEVANASVESVGDADSSIDKFIAELEIDPRSPSINVERTPIVFKHYVFLDDSIELPASEFENTNKISTPIKHSIYQDKAVVDDDTPTTPKLTQTVDKLTNNRTPLSCLANKGRPPTVQHSNKKKNNNVLKHPILFIGQQHLTPKCVKNGGGMPFGNSNNFSNKTTNGSSKIPVFKNTIL